jgi:hypothetical protein
MDNTYRTRKSSIAMKWVKAESGNTYICNVDALRGIENPTEEDLQRLCVSESENPQND